MMTLSPCHRSDSVAVIVVIVADIVAVILADIVAVISAVGVIRDIGTFVSLRFGRRAKISFAYCRETDCGVFIETAWISGTPTDS